MCNVTVIVTLMIDRSYSTFCVQRWRHHLCCQGGGQRSPPQTHYQVVQRKMDGSGQQNREALTAERDLWPIHQGTVQQGACVHHITCKRCYYANSYVSPPGRSTLLRWTSSKPKRTMLGVTGARSPTRTSLTAVPLTWKLKVCQNNKVHYIHLHIYGKNSTKCRLAYVLLLSCRSWTGLTACWYSISFQKKVKKKGRDATPRHVVIFRRSQQRPFWIQQYFFSYFISSLFLFFSSNKQTLSVNRISNKLSILINTLETSRKEKVLFHEAQLWTFHLQVILLYHI